MRRASFQRRSPRAAASLTAGRSRPTLRAEAYLREVWPAVTSALKEHGVGCELNLVRAGHTHSKEPSRHCCVLTRAPPAWRQVELKTTKETGDPGALQKCTDFVQAFIMGAFAPHGGSVALRPDGRSWRAQASRWATRLRCCAWTTCMWSALR